MVAIVMNVSLKAVGVSVRVRDENCRKQQTICVFGRVQVQGEAPVSVATRVLWIWPNSDIACMLDV